MGKPIGSKADLLQPVGSRAAYVFDISQTEGSAVPDFGRPSVDHEHLTRVRALVEQRGVEPDYANAIVFVVSHAAGLKVAERSIDLLAPHASDETKLARSLAEALDSADRTGAC